MYLFGYVDGEMGKSWTNRNNHITTNLSGIKNKSISTIRSCNQKELDSLLAEEKKFSNSKKSMIGSIKNDSKSIEKNSALIEGMKKLREMDLLTGKQMNHMRYPGIIRINNVYNDNHDRKSNPGYSRNFQGKIFTT